MADPENKKFSASFNFQDFHTLSERDLSVHTSDQELMSARRLSAGKKLVGTHKKMGFLSTRSHLLNAQKEKKGKIQISNRGKIKEMKKTRQQRKRKPQKMSHLFDYFLKITGKMENPERDKAASL